MTGRNGYARAASAARGSAPSTTVVVRAGTDGPSEAPPTPTPETPVVATIASELPTFVAGPGAAKADRANPSRVQLVRREASGLAVLAALLRLDKRWTG